VSAIAVCKAMNENKAMFKPDRYFIWWIGIMIYPVTAIIQQCLQFNRYAIGFNTDIFFCFSKLPGPCPCVSEHFPMYALQEFRSQQFIFFHMQTVCPLDSSFDI